MEIWKKIEGFEYYEVSNTGKIKSKRRIINKVNKFGTIIPILIKEKIIKAEKKHSHRHIFLSENKKESNTSIHREVYKAFKGEIPNKMVINHIDGNKSNNKIENLECITQSENIKHAYENNLYITREYKRKKNKC